MVQGRASACDDKYELPGVAQRAAFYQYRRESFRNFLLQNKVIAEVEAGRRMSGLVSERFAFSSMGAAGGPAGV